MLFIFIKLAISIKPKELCLLANAANRECSAQYEYRCVYNSCATSQAVCMKYERISILLSSKTKRVPLEFLEKYEMFYDKIKTCPELSLWKPSSVCLNAANICYGKKVIKGMRGSLMKVMERVDCECTGKQYKHKCDDSDYCGIDKRACEDFNSAEASAIKKCDI